MNASLYRNQFAILIVVLFFSCLRKSDTTVITKESLTFSESEIRPVRILNTGVIQLEIKKNNINPKFFSGIQFINGSDYFLYLDLKDSLTFINLKNNNVKRTFIGHIVKSMGLFYSSKVEGANFYFINNNTKIFYHYIITKSNDELKLVNLYKLNTSHDFTKFTFGGRGLSTNFIFHYPFLLINYSMQGKMNFIGKTGIVYFNIEDAKLIPFFIVTYPKKYFKERIYTTDLLFDMVNDSCIAYAFASSDEIGVYDLANKVETRTSIKHSCGFLAFDKSKEMNLGYINKYLLLNEVNRKILTDSNQNIYIIKQLAKQNKSDSIVKECYIMNRNLTPIMKFKFNFQLSQRFFFKTSNGFLAFSDSLNKAYCYEF